MLDNSIGCYGKLVSEVLTAISQRNSKSRLGIATI